MNDRFHAVGASYGEFWVGSPDWHNNPEIGQIGPLVAKADAGIYVRTETHTGLVGVRVNFSDEPAEPDFDDWDVVVVVIVDDPRGELCVLPLGGLGEFLTELVPGPGRFAVRCARRGGNSAPEASGELAEFVDVRIWPARPDDTDRLLKI